MLSARTPNTQNYGGGVRRCSGALLLLTIASLVVACGGDSAGWAAATATATAGGTGSVGLEWDAPLGTLVGYRIYYGTKPGVYVQILDTANTTTTYTVTGLQAATTYYFAVTAYDLSGESTYSNELKNPP